MNFAFFPVGLPILTGTAGSDFGAALAGRCDVDGDGLVELAVGAPGDDAAGTDAGAVFLYEQSGDTLDTTPVATLTGQTGERFGMVIVCVDLDGDGYDDLLVGAPDNDDAGADAGAVYVYFGSSSGLGSATQLTGEAAGDAFGTAVSAGDVDGDGFREVVVGAPYADGAGSDRGAVYVFAVSAGSVSTSASGSWTGDADGDELGTAVVAGFDMDADGYEDVAAGAPGVDGTYADNGAAVIWRGGASGPSATADLSLTPAFDVTQAGRALAIGDLDGDGFDDLVVGLYPTYVSYVQVTWGDAAISGADTTRVSLPDGELGGELQLSSGGDLDGDGVDDLLASAWANDTGGSSCECDPVYQSGAIFGSSARSLVSLDALVTFPEALSPVGDLDGNGVSEVAFGVPDEDTVTVRLLLTDADGDGFYADLSGDLADCDDTDDTAFPGALETAGDGIDQDCDGNDSVPWTHITTCPTFARLPEAKVYADDPAGAIWDPRDEYGEVVAVLAAATCLLTETADDTSGECEEQEATWADCSAAEDGIDGQYLETVWSYETYNYDSDADCNVTSRAEGSRTLDVNLSTPTARGVLGFRGRFTSGNGSTEDDLSGLLTWADGTISSVDQRALSYSYSLDDWGHNTGSEDARGGTIDGCAFEIAESSTHDYDVSTRVWTVAFGSAEAVVSWPGSEFCDGYDGTDAVATLNGATSLVDVDTWEQVPGVDADGDGWPLPWDCDDTVATTHPCAEEVPGNLADDDCDGIYEGDPDADGDGMPDALDCAPDHPLYAELVEAWEDVDGDGWGGASAGTVCQPSEGIVLVGGDCDDADASVHPEAVEHCDGIDEDCDGELDNDAVDAVQFYWDEDGDGYGGAAGDVGCEAPEGQVDNGDDCDDSDPTIHPGATDIPDDGIDQDCDGKPASEAPGIAHDTGASESPKDEAESPFCGSLAVLVAGVPGMFAMRRRRAG